jgi:hypothetical protein
LVLLAAGCVAPPSTKSSAQVPPELTVDFRACYSDAKKIWFSGLAVEEHAPESRIASGIEAGFNGDQRADAYRDVRAMQNGQYKTAEELASKWFLQCARRGDLARRDLTRVPTCFEVYRMTFEMSVVRARQFLADPRFKGLVMPDRITGSAKKIFTVLRPGSESAYFEAEFLVCVGPNV